MLDRPDFTLDKPNTLAHATDAEWWLRWRLQELEPNSRFAGIYANKSGFHNTGNNNERYWPGNYSIRDTRNRRGEWWREYASAIDWTFPDAQAGDYKTIAKYTKRLFASALNPADPRLDLIVFEWYGQDDSDTHVEGYNELREEFVTSDPRHLWHLHMSFFRDACGDMWAMWALLTVLMGWTVEQWRASLPDDAPAPQPAPNPSPLPNHAPGSRTLRQGMTGTDVAEAQRRVNAAGGRLAVDGVFGPVTHTGVQWYQATRRLGVDGVVGPRTWASMLSGFGARNLRRGARGNDVRELQRLLGAHGAQITVDGVFGPATDSAVRKFQQQYRLAVDGIVGPVTAAALVRRG